MLLAVLLACGSSALLPPNEVALTPPWSAMELPIDEATIIASRPTTLHVLTPAADLDVQLATWQAALQAQGWQVDLQQPGPDHPALRFTDDDGTSLQVALHTAPDHTAITLALVPGVVP